MSAKTLKKELGLYDVFSISTGAMFSSGFFLLPGLAAAQTGESVYLAYLASGLLIIPAMLSVAELSTAMPRAGGAYYFLDRSLGPLVGTIGGLGSWIALTFKSAFALIGMGAYLALYVDISFTVLALILTVLFGILNIFGAKETTILQRVLVTILVFLLGIFTIQGLASITDLSFLSPGKGYGDFFRGEIHGFIATIGLVFVSYAGLTKVASVAEEVKDPDRNIPLGMALSLGTAIALYVLGVYVMLHVLPPEEFYSSLTPVADAGERFLSWLPGSTGVVAMVVAAVAAFASTGNAGIMSASRYPFAMARDRLVSERFARIGKTGTPTFSIMVTTTLMIVVLMVFDVEAVAKLASAFQLLLFGFLCVSVIVMRESRIDAYAPGFNSPLYPWTQIAGMLISVWLIAEMGLLAVALSGIIIVLSVAWYYYYAGDTLQRQGAIYHVHERLGRNRYEGLEYELLSILNEKNSDKKLAYEEVIAKSDIIDTDESLDTLEKLIERSADSFAERTGIDRERISERTHDRYRDRFTQLAHGVTVSYQSFEADIPAEMIIFRLAPDSNRTIEGIEPGTRAVIFLVTPLGQPGLDMRLVGHLAEIVEADNFPARWDRADSVRKLREILISDERFAHIIVRENSYFTERTGREIREVDLPGSGLIAIIYRKGELVIPHGNTVLGTEDELFIIGEPNEIRILTGFNSDPERV